MEIKVSTGISYLSLERIPLVLLSFFARTSIWLFQDKVSSISMPRYAANFARVRKCPFNLILDKIQFINGSKSNNLVFDSFRESLSQSVTNYSAH